MDGDSEMSENPWINVEDELPPCDGIYEVSEDQCEWYVGIVTYDGVGFLYGFTYRNPKFWRYPVKLEKKYGKQNERKE